MEFVLSVALRPAREYGVSLNRTLGCVFDCGYSTRDGHFMDAHLRSHFTGLSCPKCEHVAASQSILAEHIMMIHYGLPTICGVCRGQDYTCMVNPVEVVDRQIYLCGTRDDGGTVWMRAVVVSYDPETDEHKLQSGSWTKSLRLRNYHWRLNYLNVE